MAVLRALHRADAHLLLRYTLILEQGHGAAPEEIFAADRTLQILGVVWAIVSDWECT